MIHVVDNIYLDSDRYCFIVKEEKVTETGKNVGEKYMVELSYHGKHDQVIDKLMDIAMGRMINKDILGCVRLIEATKEKFNEILKLKHGN